jgi:hypothetical protein
MFDLTVSLGAFLSRKAVVATLVGLLVLGATGCSAIVEVQTRVSMASTCASAAGIMTKMGEVGQLITSKPEEAGTYADRLSELSNDLEALSSGDFELDTALSDVSSGVDMIVESLRNPGRESLAAMPEQIEQTKLEFIQVADVCQGLLRQDRSPEARSQASEALKFFQQV